MTNEDGKTHSKAPTYGKVFVDLMHDLGITDGAVRLYAHMHWRYGKDKKNFEGQTSMAQFMGVSEKTIRNRIDELEANDWVVTIYIELEGNPGRWQNCFYHVFEDKDECRQFRDTYKTGEHETIKPKPEARERKSRKGVGNADPVRPNSSSDGEDNDRPNSSSTAPQNSGSDGHQNSSSTARPNSSSEYLSVVNPAKANPATVNPSSSSLSSPSPTPARDDDDDDLNSNSGANGIGQGKTNVRIEVISTDLDAMPAPPVHAPFIDRRANEPLHLKVVAHLKTKTANNKVHEDDMPAIIEDTDTYGVRHCTDMIDHCSDTLKEMGKQLFRWGYVHSSLINQWGAKDDPMFKAPPPKPDEPRTHEEFLGRLKTSPYASFYDNDIGDTDDLPESA